MVRVIRNSDVKRIVAFIPPKHKHVRLYIEFNDEKLVFQEATINAILRAYINVAFHPIRKAVELRLKRLSTRKSGYAEYQNLETNKTDEEILLELDKLLSSLQL